jgi:probable phosphoglycerate mutase
MEVYFVRHGQTGGNVAKRHQAETTVLSKKGEEQARVVAKKLATLHPTHLISSTHVRTLQTAKIISDEINVTVETSPVFTELHRPKAVYGHRHLSLRSLLFIVKWYLGYAGKEIGDDEGESYESLRVRIGTARDYLEKLPDDSRVVVVSHALFMSMFLAHVCQDKPLTLMQAIKYWFKLSTIKNTAIKHFKVDLNQTTCRWKLIRE